MNIIIKHFLRNISYNVYMRMIGTRGLQSNLDKSYNYYLLLLNVKYMIQNKTVNYILYTFIHSLYNCLYYTCIYVWYD